MKVMFFILMFLSISVFAQQRLIGDVVAVHRSFPLTEYSCTDLDIQSDGTCIKRFFMREPAVLANRTDVQESFEDYTVEVVSYTEGYNISCKRNNRGCTAQEYPRVLYKLLQSRPELRIITTIVFKIY